MYAVASVQGKQVSKAHDTDLVLRILLFQSEWGLRNPTQKELIVPGRAQPRKFCCLPHDLTACIPNVN